MDRVDAVLRRWDYRVALVDLAAEISNEDDSQEWRDRTLLESLWLSELAETEVWDLAARLTCYDPAYIAAPSSVKRPALQQMDALINSFMALRDEVYLSWKSLCREEVAWRDHLAASADARRKLPGLMRRIAGEVVKSYG